MEEKKNDNQVPEIKINNEALKSLTNNLLKNDDSINALMKMATNLLGDGSLLNSVKDLNKLKQNTSIDSLSRVGNKDISQANEKSSAQTEMKKEVENMQTELANQLSTFQTTLTSNLTAFQAEIADYFKTLQNELFKQILTILEALNNYSTTLQAEIAELKAQNEKLLEQISYIQNNYKIKKKR